MKKHIGIIGFYGILLLTSACASQSPTASTQTGIASSKTKSGEASRNEHHVFQQDLSSFRPKFKDQDDASQVVNSAKASKIVFDNRDVPLYINKRLDPILDTIASQNKNIKFANGFRIQIYVGNDRKSADDAKVYTYQTYPEIFPYLTFQQPVYKVKVGDFLNRMDAERYFSSIKETYPSALILPDKVEIKKGMFVK